MGRFVGQLVLKNAVVLRRYMSVSQPLQIYRSQMGQFAADKTKDLAIQGYETFLEGGSLGSHISKELKLDKLSNRIGGVTNIFLAGEAAYQGFEDGSHDKELNIPQICIEALKGGCEGIAEEMDKMSEDLQKGQYFAAGYHASIAALNVASFIEVAMVKAGAKASGTVVGKLSKEFKGESKNNSRGR